MILSVRRRKVMKLIFWVLRPSAKESCGREASIISLQALKLAYAGRAQLSNG